jgi:choline dehydrogenase-like flavoprotein
VLVDGRAVAHGSRVDAEVCIVGAGPAGLTLAAELLRSPYRVLIVESGGPRPDRQTDRLVRLEFESPDFDSPNETRRRRFGGMATAWHTPLSHRQLGAQYLPLDPIDFERRDWVPFSGWPFGRAALQPFYDRAGVICGLGPVVHTVQTRKGQRHAPLRFRDEIITTSVNRIASGRIFTETLRRAIAASRTTTAILHANVVGLETDDEGKRVAAASVRCLRGPSFSIRARFFVLAAGAIENARLLLLSNTALPAGLGNGYGNVGRFFMDHLYVVSGLFRPYDAGLFERTALYDIREQHGVVRRGKLTVAAEVMRREQLLNSAAELWPRWGEVHRVPIDSAKTLARAIRTGRLPPDARGHLRSVLSAVGPLASTGAQLGITQWRPQPSLRYSRWSQLKRNRLRFDAFTLVHQCEQAPNPENRVLLGDGVDALGLRVARLHWRWSELDLHSIRRVQEIYAEELERAGLGRLERDGDTLAAELERLGLDVGAAAPNGGKPWLFDRRGAHHHLGTTRMHRDRKQGVVDENCRAHDVSNLFVAGSSVFPTGGYANPTLTIVALSIRLADHIRALLAAT